MTEAPAAEFTADQIVDGIRDALRDRNVEVVPGLIKMLAVKDPHRAQEVLGTIDLGVTLSATQTSSAEPTSGTEAAEKYRPDPTSITVYASIGNSDDKLSQREWSEFVRDFVRTMRRDAKQIYGEWYSAPGEPFQNACIAAEIPVSNVDMLRAALTEMRRHFQQDSTAWAVVGETEFI